MIRPWTRPEHRPAFLLGGWVMLLVVLLCAAPTGGPPRSRIVGSAFDPATVSVAVNPKQPKMSAAAKKVLPQRDPSITLLAGLPAAANAEFPAGFGAPVARAAARVRPEVPPFPRRLLTRPLGTRAPPIA